MSDKNILGGKNTRSVYTPMSETEQEALDRLRASQDLVLEVDGIGEIPLEQANIIIGDHRLGIRFQITFRTKDNQIQTVPYLDLLLRTRQGITLFKERQPFRDINGNAMMVNTGMTIPMQWDIGINQIDEKVVKAIMPGATGLTSRRGNERLTGVQQKTLREVRKMEHRAREATKKGVQESVQRAQAPVKPDSKKMAP